MDKPPKGKDSTKGLGKKIPDQSEHVKWRDDVVVPCGKPVSSNVKASELMYNEYIVYNTDQVSSNIHLHISVLFFFSENDNVCYKIKFSFYAINPLHFVVLYILCGETRKMV